MIEWVGFESLLLTGLVSLLLLLLVAITVALRPWARRRWGIRPPARWDRGGPTADAGSDSPSADQILLDTAGRFLQAQIGTADVLDTKAAGILQVGSTVLPLTFGLLAISGRTPPRATAVLLIGALLSYGVLLWCTWQASRLRGIEFRPNLVELVEASRAFGGEQLRRWVAEEYIVSSELNRRPLILNARFVGGANTALLAEGLLASAAALIALL